MGYSKEQVLNFLESHKFKDYQRIRLPYGLEVRGTDLSEAANAILPRDLKGKSVVDIGCNYGFFCHEAKKRGADEVIGIEINKETARIAREISEIIGDGVKIIDHVDKLGSKRYDVILLLNVVHHLNNPVEFIGNIAKRCKTLVIEFPTPADEPFVIRDRGVKVSFPKLNIMEKAMYKFKLFFRRQAFGYLGRHYGIIGVGSVGYDNTFYFSQKAFEYTFRLHNKVFSKIEYRPSPRFPKRVIAFCTV